MSQTLKNIVRASVPREVRNWLRSPVNSAEWLFDAALYSLGATRRLKLLPDLEMVCHPFAYKVYRQAQIEDPEQRFEFHSFISHCREGMLLFDIGAHFGVFSITAAKMGGRAVAVDPSPISSRMIARQAALNDCENQVRILKAAVSEASGSLEMLSSGVFTPGYFKVVGGRSGRELTSAKAVTVDELTCAFGPPTHLKVDVEGHEIAVLKGARQTLGEFAPLLFLELHNEMVRSSGRDLMPLLVDLDELGYQMYRPDGELVGKASILREPIARVVGRHPRTSAQTPKAPC